MDGALAQGRRPGSHAGRGSFEGHAAVRPRARRMGAGVAGVLRLGGVACGLEARPATSLARARLAVTATPAASAAAPPEGPTLAPSLTLLLGGDVELARATGQRLLHDPAYDPFATLRRELASADVRFVNLEGPLSDQGGETMSRRNPLVFTGPPSGADALARAGVTVVSTANNHAWDYGRPALLETIASLDRVHVAHAGTGPDPTSAYAPAIVEAKGWRVALLAVMDVFNFGPLIDHPARQLIGARRSARRSRRPSPPPGPPARTSSW